MSQPSSIDNIAPFDPTAYASLSAAQIYQLVSGLIPYTDKGLIVATTDANGVAQAPDAEAHTKWKNYLWKRIVSDGSVFLYIWNDALAFPDTTFLKWQPAILSVPSSSVGTAQIQDGSVTNGKIATVNFSKIINWVAATGDITGTYPTLSVSPGSITAAKIVLKTITEAQIADTTITGAKIADDTITAAKIAKGTKYQMLRTNAGITATELFTSSSIVHSADVVTTTGNQYKIPQCATEAANDGGTWQMTSIASLQTQLAALTYVSALKPITAACYVFDAHGLAATPSFVRAVLVCQTSEYGYLNASDGGTFGADEIDVTTVGENGSGFVGGTLYANATRVGYQFPTTSGKLTVRRLSSTAGSIVDLTYANWKLKFYARL